MTDQEINRAVAEARGYTVYHYDKDFRENCYYMLMDAEFAAVVRYPDCHRATEEAAWADVPDVVNQWSAFFEELTREGYAPGVITVPNFDRFEASVHHKGLTVLIDSSPGRALALAFLKAKGKHNAV